MRKLYKIRIEADNETIFYAHIQRESYGKDIAIAVKDKDKDKDEVETVLHCIKEELIRGRS
jgi:hypothetical protein